MNQRRATFRDAQALARIHRSATKTAMPFLPDLHSPAEDLAFYQTVVLKECDVWVLEDTEIRGFIALKPGWVEHLYIATEHQRAGLGSRLLNIAKEQNDQLQLWTFQRNTGARAFYEAHGFDAAEFTEGAGNEEQEPDVRYEWQRR